MTMRVNLSISVCVGRNQAQYLLNFPKLLQWQAKLGKFNKVQWAQFVSKFLFLCFFEQQLKTFERGQNCPHTTILNRVTSERAKKYNAKWKIAASSYPFTSHFFQVLLLHHTFWDHIMSCYSQQQLFAKFLKPYFRTINIKDDNILITFWRDRTFDRESLSLLGIKHSDVLVIQEKSHLFTLYNWHLELSSLEFVL